MNTTVSDSLYDALAVLGSDVSLTEVPVILAPIMQKERINAHATEAERIAEADARRGNVRIILSFAGGALMVSLSFT